MTIVSRTFFCLECKSGPFSEENIKKHGCVAPFKVIESVITCNKKPVRRFIDWILSQDISYGLAFMGLVVMNAVLVSQIDLSFTEILLESVSLGFVIPRLLK